MLVVAVNTNHPRASSLEKLEKDAMTRQGWRDRTVSREISVVRSDVVTAKLIVPIIQDSFDSFVLHSDTRVVPTLCHTERKIHGPIQNITDTNGFIDTSNLSSGTHQYASVNSRSGSFTLLSGYRYRDTLKAYLFKFVFSFIVNFGTDERAFGAIKRKTTRYKICSGSKGYFLVTLFLE